MKPGHATVPDNWVNAVLLAIFAILALITSAVHARDAEEVLRLKGGFESKKLALEMIRADAYALIAVKEMRNSLDWTPDSPLWKRIQQGLAADFLAAQKVLARRFLKIHEPFSIDPEMLRRYEAAFTAPELEALKTFYGSDAGRAHTEWNQKILAFHGSALVHSLYKFLYKKESVQATLESSESARRLDELLNVANLFETVAAVEFESRRVGGGRSAFVYMPVSKLAIALNIKEWESAELALTGPVGADLRSFLRTNLGRKERNLVVNGLARGEASEDASRDVVERAAKFHANLTAMMVRKWRRESTIPVGWPCSGEDKARIDRLRAVESKIREVQVRLKRSEFGGIATPGEAANHLYFGRCVERNVSEAIRWYRLSVEKIIDRRAMEQFIIILTHGKDVRSDPGEIEQILVSYEEQFGYEPRNEKHVVDWLETYESASVAGSQRATCRLAEFWENATEYPPAPEFANYLREGRNCSQFARRPNLESAPGAAGLVRREGRYFFRDSNGKLTPAGRNQVQDYDE